jgi:hypothetical protein
MRGAIARLSAAVCLAVVSFVAVPAGHATAGASLPGATRDSWIELRTPSFVTLTNAGERKGREIALGFERFRAALQMLRPAGVQQPLVPTRILVFDSDDDFDPYKPGSEQRRKLLLGLFQQSSLGNYILINGHPAHGSAMPIVYHEYAHSVAHAAFAQLPLWLDEGLAEFYSTFEVERTDLLVGKPVVGHVQTMRERSFLPLAQLFAVDHESPDYQEGERAGIFYAESWLMVHYLMLGGPERLQRTRAFLEGVRQGEAPEKAFVAAFGHGFEQLEKDLRGYVNASTFPFLRLPQAQLGPEPEVAVRPVARGDLLFELGNSLALRSGSEPAARAHLEAAAGEGVGDAWAVLATLEERAGHAEAAAGLYRKATAAGASRPTTQLLIARAQLEAPGAGADAALAARALLQRVVAAEPSFAEARALLGKTWRLTDDDPAPGIAYLGDAYDQLRGRADIAYDLAMLQLKAGQVAKAEELVRTVVVPMGNPELAAHARRAVEHAKASNTVNAALQSGDAARAVAALQTALAEATDPELRAELEARLREAQAFQARQAQIERYNAAIAQANAGKIAEARAELRTLRGEVTDADLGKAIDGILAQLDEAPRR